MKDIWQLIDDSEAIEIERCRRKREEQAVKDRRELLGAIAAILNCSISDVRDLVGETGPVIIEWHRVMTSSKDGNYLVVETKYGCGHFHYAHVGTSSDLRHALMRESEALCPSCVIKSSMFSFAKLWKRITGRG